MAESIKRNVIKILDSVNWLLESHDSFAELIEIKGNKVIIRCQGHCAECEDDCIGVAFRESMPEVELVFSE